MEIFNGIPKVNPERNYWLVRTNGGKYFSDFHLNNYIAIGWDKITDLSIINNEHREELIDEIKEKYNSKKDVDEEFLEGEVGKKVVNYGLIANQLIRFVKEMKKGDIVIIPSENSKHVAFGEIVDDEVYIEDINPEDLESTECPYVKRRRVNWIKLQKKNELDIYLYKMLNSHHSITCANEHAAVIDRTIYQFYIKGDNAYLTIRVNSEESISGVDLSGFIYNTISLVDSYNSATGNTFNKREVETKINVHSPGIIEFIGPVTVIGCIALGTTVLLGGEVSFMGIKLKTDGLSKTLLEWAKALNEMKKDKEKFNQKEKEIIETAKNLKISIPYAEQLKSYLVSLNESVDGINEAVVNQKAEKEEEKK